MTRVLKPAVGAQLNRSHPLAKGLITALLMNERGGQAIFDAVDGKAGAFSIAGGYPNWSNINPDGSGLTFAGTNANAHVSLTKTALNAPTAQSTFAIRLYVNNFPDSGRAYLANLFSDEHLIGDFYTLWRIGSQGSSSLARRVGINFYDGVDHDAESTVDLPQQTWLNVFVVTTGTQALFYYNKQLVSTISYSIVPVNGAQNWRVVSRGAGGGEQNGRMFDGQISWIYRWNRILAAQEIAAVDDDPYAMFRLHVPVFAVPASGNDIPGEGAATLSFSTVGDPSLDHEAAVQSDLDFTTTSQPEVEHESASSASLAFVTTAESYVEIEASTSAQLQFSTVADGQVDHETPASSEIAFTTTAQPEVEHESTAQSDLAFVTIGQSSLEIEATVQADLAFVTTGQGDVAIEAAVQASLTFTTNADYELEHEAAVQSDLVFTTVADSELEHESEAQSDLVFTTTGNGELVGSQYGEGQATVAFSTTAVGSVEHDGQGDSTLSFAPAEQHIKESEQSGSAVLEIITTGSGVLSDTIDGSGSAVLAYSTTGDAQQIHPAQAQSTLAFISIGSGDLQAGVEGEGTAILGFDTVGVPQQIHLGSGSASLTFSTNGSAASDGGGKNLYIKDFLPSVFSRLHLFDLFDQGNAMIALRDLPSIYRPVGDFFYYADVSAPITLEGPSIADGVVLWTEDQDIRVKIMNENSTDEPTAQEGIPITTEDGLRYLPLWKTKVSFIEQNAGAKVQGFYIEFDR